MVKGFLRCLNRAGYPPLINDENVYISGGWGGEVFEMKMGCVNSKTEKSEALRLCKERKRLIKVAIDSRYALAAAHLSYIQSLRNIGVALRRYAEAEMLLESSLSVSDHTPSQSTYPSPSPSDSPLNNESQHHVNYVKTIGSAAVTVMTNPHIENLLVDEAIESDASWDFFDPAHSTKSFDFAGHASYYKDEEETNSFLDASRRNDYCNLSAECYKQKGDGEMRQLESSTNVSFVGRSSSKNNKNVAVNTEREDPSEFISHRAKDFLSSVKVIEHRFVRASESGREVSRILEANKIKVGYSEPKGKSSATIFLAAFMFGCFSENAIPVSQEPAQKIISWKRTESSQSASIRNPLVTISKTYMDDSCSDFVEEPCMISGSHSCTLERLYAWERKLYDEVQAGEFIRKEFDRKCDQLRHQFAKDESSRVIDKTRSVVKDLHSRIIVAIYSADLISKRIEMMRDEELFPQLLEFTQGLMRMWKAMLECHHAQYITMSLAYHSRSSMRTLEGDTRREIMAQLLKELECLGLSLSNWINSHTSYIESLNGWLQNCILEPRERSKNRKPFSPRRVLAPPIFVLCRDWCAGIKALPYEELSHTIEYFVSNLHRTIDQQGKELREKYNSVAASTSGETESKTIGENEDDSSHLCYIHESLTKLVHQLTKFSEASLKMHEDIRQKCEAAQTAYHSCRSIRTGKI